MKDVQLARPTRTAPSLTRGLHRVLSLFRQRGPRQSRRDARGAVSGQQTYQIPLEPWHIAFIDALLLKIPLQHARVLDIGCGRGEVAREVIRRVGEVVIHGIDSDLCGLADVQEETGNRLTIHKMDVVRLDFPDGYFDAAYSLNVFEHIGDVPSAYRELRRVLRPGGRLYLYSSPIWTSYRGHHYNHWDSEFVDLIPPWGHLYMGRQRLFDEVAQKKGVKVAADAIRYIFESSYLNRVSLGAHKRFVQESGLTILECAEAGGVEFIDPPSPEYVEQVARATGLSQDELVVDGIGLLLERA